jgi:hypothetical protein
VASGLGSRSADCFTPPKSSPLFSVLIAFASKRLR